LNNIVRDYYDAQEQLNDQTYSDANNFSNITIDSLTENFSVDIYHHFTIYDGKKWLITTDA